MKLSTKTVAQLMVVTAVAVDLAMRVEARFRKEAP